MQLNATPIQWPSDALMQDVEPHKFDYLVSRLEDALWPSDSCVQYGEVSEAYHAIRHLLSSATRSAADKLMSEIINQDLKLPKDLGPSLEDGQIIGSASPGRVRDLLAAFHAIDYSEMNKAFDEYLPESFRNSLQIAKWPSEEIFTGYLRQWENMHKICFES